MDDYNLLVSKGTIGFYNSCEVTEIFLHHKNEEDYFNLFTLVCFEEKIIEEDSKEQLLGYFDLNKEYNLGIIRYNLTLDSIKSNFKKLKFEGIWNSNVESQSKDYSKLNKLSKQFVLSTKTKNIPLNNLLKNNFYNGSYVLEFFEEDKTFFNNLFENDSFFDDICTEIRKKCNLNLYRLEDRLGNFIFQFPITILDLDINGKINDLTFNFQWHPNLSKLPNCYIMIDSVLDNNYMDFKLIDYNGKNEQKVSLTSSNYHKYIKFHDLNNDLLLYCSKENFLKNINGYVNISNKQERYFEFKGIKNNIIIKESSNPISLGIKKDYETHINKRTNKIEKDTLINSLSFKIYKNNHKEAISDLQHLIQKNCQNGVYLMDPFLSPEDIVKTLFFANIYNVPLKALGSFNKNVKNVYKSKVCKRFVSKTKDLIYLNKKDLKNNLFQLVKSFEEGSEDNFTDLKISDYKKEFEKIQGNFQYGLNLEFRVQHSNYGHRFHDRFLIFPGNKHTGDELKVYSLGTSINSFGKDFNIFQEVSHPQLIFDEFNKLWDELNKEECIVWKSH